MTITLDDYLNKLDVSAVGSFKITEVEDKSETRQVVSLISKATTILGKLKDKNKAKKELKQIEKLDRTKRIEKILKANTSSTGELNKVAAKQKIIKEFGEGIKEHFDRYPINILSLILNIYEWISFKIQTHGYYFPIHVFASIISTIAELPVTAIIRLTTKTSKSHKELITDLESDKGYQKLAAINAILSLVKILISIGILGASFTMAGLAGAALALMSMTLIKLVYAIYIGYKRNNWKYYEKAVKASIGESIIHTFGEYLESAVFISSLREDLVDRSTDNKDFLQFEATDYEILYFTIEGTFPTTNSGDCQTLIDILNIELNLDLISIDEAGISTQGLNSTVLIETIFNNSTFNQTTLFESNLLEAKVDAAKLAKLKKMMDNAKKEFIRNHPDKGGDPEKAKQAGAAFQDAKERYETYKKSGVDPGEHSYTKSTGRGGAGAGAAAGPDWFRQFVNKVWTFSPKNTILNILRKVYGAEKLAKVIKVTPALAGGVILMGGAVVAALFSWASYRAYSRFFSQAAKACQGKSSSNAKSICMKKFEIAALDARHKDLSKVIKFCDRLKKTEQRDCELSLKGKINDLSSDLRKAKEDLAKLEKKAA